MGRQVGHGKAQHTGVVRIAYTHQGYALFARSGGKLRQALGKSSEGEAATGVHPHHAGLGTGYGGLGMAVHLARICLAHVIGNT